MKYGWVYETPIGKILINESDNKIVELHFGVGDGDFEMKETPLLKEAGKQLNEYFLNKRKEFDLPFELNGTEFQMDVWNGLTQIKYGETISYKELASKIGRENASRAVGSANAKNPLPIFIPCHRVIKSDKKLGGYLGNINDETNIKQYLLDLEQK